MGKWISEAFQDALKEPGDVQKVSLVNSDDDDSHYIFENIVNELFEKLPELQVAIYAQYEDTEYGECDAENLLYSPRDIILSVICFVINLKSRAPSTIFAFEILFIIL